jgi:transposase InsO family protein
MARESEAGLPVDAPKQSAVRARRKFVVTTDSNHGRKVYPNLASKVILTAIDQLWRADITYIRLRDNFVFLAVILHAYSRRVIG